jgi:nucleotidyltransferase/DNA polymerase involved in DNA repair
LKYVAPEDIHVYSIDEVFIDATDYLKAYKLTPFEMTLMLIQNVLKNTGITATAGIAYSVCILPPARKNPATLPVKICHVTGFPCQ